MATKNTKLSKVMKMFRLNRDMALKEFAEKMNCSSAYLSAIEYGKIKIPSTYYENVCKLLVLNDIEKRNLLEAILETSNDYTYEFKDEQEKNLFLIMLQMLDIIRNNEQYRNNQQEENNDTNSYLKTLWEQLMAFFKSFFDGSFNFNQTSPA